MTKQEILVELLKKRQSLVEKYRASREYGEWSCGQQDADSDNDSHYDKVMKIAISIAEGRDIQDMDKYMVEDAKELMQIVLEDFYLTIQHHFGL